MNLKRLMGALALTLPLAVSADYSKHPQAQKLILELAKSDEFTVDELTAVFQSAERKDSILKAMSRPAEKVKPWYEYRKIFISDRRINQGVEFWTTHQDALNAASEKTGVPAKVIVAIIGVETSFGRNMGSHRVVDALSTLAFDYPRRSAFFTKELKAYLKLAKQQGVDPLSLKGSYAGAMGYGQFMPSSYLAYAVDGDGDGKVDIWGNPTDAIHSVANYFKRHGWQKGGEVIADVTLADSVQMKAAEGAGSRKKLKPSLNVGEWQAKGFKTDAKVADSKPAALLKFDQPEGVEYKMGFNNFYTITRYNISSMYARAVWELAGNIEEKK